MYKVPKSSFIDDSEFSSNSLLGYSKTFKRAGTTSSSKTIYVSGYTKKNGTHVNSYYRSAPHSNR